MPADTPQEESAATLSLDSGVTLQGIYLALESYARTIPGAAVPKITFEQTPNIKEGSLLVVQGVNQPDAIWRAGVSLQCLGGLERKGEVPKEGSFLTGVEPTVVYSEHWVAEGVGFAGAVEELRDVVEKHLQELISQRQQDLQSASEALRVLRNPTELDNVWSLQDNPQDEAAADEHDVQEGQ